MHKFSSCTNGLIEPCCLKTWIRTAIARNVRELYIRNYVSVLDLPSWLFTCGTLEVLALWGLLEIDVPNLVCPPRLTHITLAGVRVNECLSKLVSGCPILESLHFEGRCYNLMRIFTISSPSLKRLHLNALYDLPEDHPDCKVEIDTPALEYLYVRIDMYHGFDVAIQSMSSLAEEHIEFNDRDYFGDPSEFSDPVTQLFPALNCVKFLTLSGATMEESYGPYAENLESCRRNTEEIPRCLRTSLEQFKFGKLEGVEDELTVIGYILKHGGVLKRMELWSAVSDVNTKFQLTQKILLFPRRSPTCQIAFH